jgi:flavin reductase (DIM6/NTAB) family NADH-FMN oxidoreductase RutF
MSNAETSLYESFGRYGSSITLVTTRDGDHDRFFIAGSVLTASVDPFTLAVSTGIGRDALPAILDGRPWAVSVLSSRHLSLVQQLTAKTTREDRLAALKSAGAQKSLEGPLWLPDALVTFWCAVSGHTPVNDQVLIVGNVTRGSQHVDGTPLVRWNRGFHTTSALTSSANPAT